MNINRKKCSLAVSLICLGFGSSFYSFALEQDKEIEIIKITSDRINSFSAQYVQAGTFNNAHLLDTPLTTNVITQELLGAQLATSLADAVRNTAGVSAAQINTTIYSNLNIRGIRLENTTNYRLNGVLPIANYVQMPLENKYRVEVLKGAAGLYYGFGSPAGVVNLVTERAEEDGLQGKLFFNQHGTAGISLDVSKVFDNAGVRVNLAKADEEIGINETSGERDFASIGYHWDASEALRIELDGEYISRDITEPTQYYLLANEDGIITLPPLQDNSTHHGADWFKAQTDAYNLLANVEYFLLDDLYFSLSLGKGFAETTRRYSAFYGYDIETGEDGVVALSTFPDTEYDNQIIEFKLTGQFELADIANQWVIGASKRENVAVIPDRVRQGKFPQHLYNPIQIAVIEKPERVIKNQLNKVDKGYFISILSEFNEQWQTTFGYRYADYKNTNFLSQYHDKEGTVSASLMYKPQENLSFYGSYIEGLEEGGIAQGIAKNAGEVLPAALSEQIELGAKYETDSNLLYTLAYFDIDRVSAFIHPQTQYYVQDGRANYSGVEFSASGELAKYWSVAGSATYIDAVQEQTSSAELTGNAIENTPEKTASLFLNYSLPLVEGLSFSIGGFYTGSRYIDALNVASAGGYTVYDFGASYEFNVSDKPVNISVYAQNVTNKTYWAATGSRLLAQGHPRTIKLELKTQF